MTADRDLGIQQTELKREAASERKVTVPRYFVQFPTVLRKSLKLKDHGRYDGCSGLPSRIP